MQKPKLHILKIGGNVIDQEASLQSVLAQFSKIEGAKVLVHGGGKAASLLSEKLGITPQMIEGRRVTDLPTLEIAVQVYGGLINRSLVAKLQALKVNSCGVSGADFNLIRAAKRKVESVDFGWVGDVSEVNSKQIEVLLAAQVTPVFAPLTHDGEGQLLNTNADTIATELALAMASRFEVTLIYSFEKKGVLTDLENENSCLSDLGESQFESLKKDGKIFSGMIPKLTNAFRAIRGGVNSVLIGNANELAELLQGKTGTRLS